MDFTVSRSDISFTAYVPWNCTNNCNFCSSKKDYSRVKPDFDKLISALEIARKSIIPVVVFTGGEPSSDLSLLKKALDVVDNRTVYINTSLPQKNAEGFIELVNSTPWIHGVSISRHFTSYEQDSCFLHDIAPDELITKFTKPIRINVVEWSDSAFSHKNILKYVSRWEKISQEMEIPLLLNLRGNYNKQDPHLLHDLSQNSVVNDLANTFYYDSHNFCNVCDTCSFILFRETNPTLFINYHRGLATTSIKFGKITEVNDIIIFPDGSIVYDWDGKNQGIDEFLELIKN